VLAADGEVGVRTSTLQELAKMPSVYTRQKLWVSWTRSHWRLTMCLTSAGPRLSHCFLSLCLREVVAISLPGWVSTVWIWLGVDGFQNLYIEEWASWLIDRLALVLNLASSTPKNMLVSKLINDIYVPGVICGWLIDGSCFDVLQVSLVSIPSREELRQKNLFSVSDCKMYWQSSGEYLAVKVYCLLSV
jgi:hypothetical protein